MIPTADHGVGARFSRGNALMVSNGPSSAIMLLPVRYNDTQKFFFSIAALQHLGLSDQHRFGGRAPLS